MDVADPVEDVLVVEERAIALAARDEQDVRLGHLFDGRVGGDPEPAGVGSELAGVGRDEGELEARKAREHLVRADGVEGGELGENEDGDLHAGMVAGTD